MLRDGEGECVEHYGLVIGLAIPEEPEPARPKLSGAVRFRDRELYPGLEIAGDSFESFLGIFRLCFQWLAWIRPIAPRMPTYCLHKVIEMWAVKTCARRCAGGGWGRPREPCIGIFCRGFSRRPAIACTISGPANHRYPRRRARSFKSRNPPPVHFISAAVASALSVGVMNSINRA